MMIVVRGAVVWLRSCTRVAIEPAAAHRQASDAKPTRKNSTNQPATGATRAIIDLYSVNDMPTRAAATISTTWERASSELPTTLPMSNCRIGTAAARISTIRDSFSVTTDCAICMPNVIAENMNRIANAKVAIISAIAADSLPSSGTMVRSVCARICVASTPLAAAFCSIW